MHDGSPMEPIVARREAALGVETLDDRLYGLRDRVLASPTFQKWAAILPFTRWTARRKASAVFDLCAGFVYSQILYACVHLRVFDVLSARALPMPELAARIGLSVESTTRLVRAAQSLDLLSTRRNSNVGLGMLGAALRGNPGAIAMIEHHHLLYTDLADPIGLLRGTAAQTELSRYWPYAATDRVNDLSDSQITPYTRLMGRSQSLIAEDVLAAYDMGRHRVVLDVAGGDGSFLDCVGARHPHLQRKLLDLPAVIRCAEARPPLAGATPIECIAGDFTVPPLPSGADLISLVRVALDHDDATVLALFKAVYEALPVGGTLLLAEPMRDLPGAERVGDAYFGFYLLAMGRGRARSPAEHRALLTRAGFVAVRSVATRRPLLTGLIVAKRE